MRFNPARTLAIGFLALIGLGTVLLLLPFASTNGVSVVDALFTITSAVSTTGLVVLDTGKDWTLFGQIVIMTYFQIGGLGYMVFATILLLLAGGHLSWSQRILAKESLAQFTLGGVLRFMVAVLIVTVIIESLGALLLFPFFARHFPTTYALYLSLFHSVSAFCTAGFSIFSDSFVSYRSDAAFHLVIFLLELAGGIGFVVIVNIYERLRRRHRLSLHSKVALWTTLLLIAGGFITILLAEVGSSGTIEALPLKEKILVSLFHTISASTTTGFNTFAIGEFTLASLFVMILLMFIGASPGGTGGGVKTTTFAVLLANLRRTIRNEKDVNIFKRRLPAAIINRAFTIVFLSLIWIAVATLILLYTEKREFVSILFEVVSAFGTVGLSTGITPTLSEIGKCLLAATMLFGRIGLLTFGMSLILRFKVRRFRYLEEEVLVG